MQPAFFCCFDTPRYTVLRALPCAGIKERAGWGMKKSEQVDLLKELFLTSVE